jgi:hypothetical protein
MERKIQKLQVTVEANDLKSSQGYLMVLENTKQERTSKALKTFFIFFGAACVSVFIPLVHFILVPLLLITAVFTAQKKLKATHYIEEGKITCPHCGKDLEVKKTALQWPMTVFCENDRIFLNIKKNGSL